MTELIYKRTRESKHFVLPDGTIQSVFGRNLHYQKQDGTWEDVDLTIQHDDDENIDFIENAQVQIRTTPTGIRMDEVITGAGFEWLFNTKPLQSDGNTFTATFHGITWSIIPKPYGIKVYATIANKFGKRNFSIPYQLHNTPALQVVDGNLVSGEAFVIPAPIAIGANNEVYTIGAWALSGSSTATLKIDDRHLPSEALPYTFDPATTFSVAAAGDDISIGRRSTNSNTSGWTSANNFSVSPDTLYAGQQFGTPTSGNYHYYTAGVRWDTSTIPAAAVIQSAQIQLSVLSKTTDATTVAWSLSGEWYTGVFATSNAGFYARAIGSTAFIERFDDLPTAGNTYTKTVSNPDANINRSGMTAIRIGYNGPTTITNNVALMQFASYEHTTATEPRLIVTYSISMPGLTDDFSGTVIDTSLWTVSAPTTSDDVTQNEVLIVGLNDTGSVGADRLAPFTNWLTANSVEGFIGEYGWPRDDPRWNTVGETFLDAADAAGLSATYWAGGSWWGTYSQRLDPDNLGAGGTGTDQPQMAVVGAHAELPTPTYRRGVNLAGAEFGSALPGTYGVDYIYPNNDELDYYESKNLNLIRLPFRWERIQPTLGAALDSAELARINAVVTAAEARGMTVVLDLHNYGRYTQAGVERTLGDGVLTSTHLADVWTRLATYFQGRSVWYGLMNEPHDLPGGFSGTNLYNWDTSVQGWVAEAGTTRAHETTIKRTGAGSLKMTSTFGTGFSSMAVNNNDGSLADRSALGDTLSAWVYLPVGTPGTDWKAKLIVQNASYTWISGGTVDLVAGQWKQITFTPPAGLLANCRAFFVQAEANGANASVSVYIDDYEQGSTSSGFNTWLSAAQEAVNAIRATGATEKIAAGGYAWSGAHSWATNNNAFLLTDSADNLIYEAHQYFDDDSSGTYNASYDTEVLVSLTGAAQLSSNLSYDLHASEVYFQFVRNNLPASGGPNFTFKLYYDATNFVDLIIDDTQIITRLTNAGSATNGTPVTYSATAHRFFRIRESASVLYWETSADGSSWSTLRSTTTPTFLDSTTAVQVRFLVDGTSVSAGNVVIDNLNIPARVGSDTHTVSSIETFIGITILNTNRNITVTDTKTVSATDTSSLLMGIITKSATDTNVVAATDIATLTILVTGKNAVDTDVVVASEVGVVCISVNDTDNVIGTDLRGTSTLEISVPTLEDIILGRAGGLSYTFGLRYYRSDLVLLADLSDAVHSMKTDWDESRTIKRTVSFSCVPGTVELEHNGYVEPYVIIDFPSPYTETLMQEEYSLGFFTSIQHTITISDTGGSISYVAHGRVVHLINKTVDTIYTINAGTSYTTAIRTLCIAAGFTDPEVVLPIASATIPTAMTWEAGTSYYAIIEKLCDAINWNAPYMGKDTRLYVTEMQDFNFAMPDVLYATDEDSIILPDISVNHDLYAVINNVIISVDDPLRTPFSVTYTNNSANSPFSYTNTGVKVTRVIEDLDHIANSTIAATRAKLLAQRLTPPHSMNLTTWLDFRREFYEIYNIYINIENSLDYHISSIWRCVAWEMNLSTGGMMTHKLVEVLEV